MTPRRREDDKQQRTKLMIYIVMSVPVCVYSIYSIYSINWCVCVFVVFSLNMNDIQETCQKNAAAALSAGRRDVAKVTILYAKI